MSVPVTEELAHLDVDIEVLDVLGKASSRDGAIVESELDVSHATMVHPMENKTK